MIKKGVIVFCLVLLVFLPFFSSYAQGENLATESAEEEYDFASMSTYEMFWPIVAGKVPGDRLYSLKLWRDKLISYLFFSKLKKSEYLKQLANKRLIEAERLVEVQRSSYLPETLKMSGDNLEKGLDLLFSASESQSRFWLREEYVKDLQKHLIVLDRMGERGEEKEKRVVEKSIERVKNLIDKYSLEVEE